MGRRLLILLCLAFGGPAKAGEIIFVDPAREKAAQAPKPEAASKRTERMLDQTLDEARLRSGRPTPLRVEETSVPRRASAPPRHATTSAASSPPRKRP
jgi:hypothetical protein